MIQGVKTCIDENGRVVLDVCIDEDGRGIVIPCGETCSFMPWQTVNLPASEPCGGADYDVTTEMPFVRGASWRGIFVELTGRYSEHSYSISSDQQSLIGLRLGIAEGECHIWPPASISEVSYSPGTASSVLRHRVQNLAHSVASDAAVTECVELDSIVGVYSGAVGKVYSNPADGCCALDCSDGPQPVYNFQADLPLWRGAGGQSVKLSLNGSSGGQGLLALYRWSNGQWVFVSQVTLWEVDDESCGRADISGEYAIAVPGNLAEAMVVLQQRTVNQHYGGASFFVEDVRYE